MVRSGNSENLTQLELEMGKAGEVEGSPVTF